MKARITTPLYYIVLGLWGLYLPFFINRKCGNVQVPDLLNNHFTDLLCIPLVLGSTLILLQILKNDNELKLSMPKIIVAVTYFSVVFEWLLPKYKSIYIGDLLDVLCYLIGGVLFYFLQVLHFRKLGSV